MRIPAGMIVKQIIDEKKLKAADIGKKLGISRQSVYQSYAKMIFSDTEISKWSDALGVAREEFVARWESGSPESSSVNGEASVYLMEHLSSLEQQFIAFAEHSKALNEQFQNQLAVKDRQIEKLMDLLGKLNPASEMSKVKKMYEELELAS